MLIIDVSPIFINKTAMYHIVFDTAYWFLNNKKNVKIQVLDEFIDSDEFLSWNKKIPENILNKFKNKILNKINNFNINNYKKYYSLSDCYIVFDPLYAILSKINIDRSIIYVLDITPVSDPEWHNSYIAQLYKYSFEIIFSSKAQILSISKSTYNDLRANYGINSEIIPLYIRNIDESNNNEIKKNFKQLLFVGSLELRKNIINLCKAFEMSKLADYGYKLIIIGGDGKGHEKIKQCCLNKKGVILLGFVDEKKLSKLYKESTWFIYPSFKEGFGLPLLEAMKYNLVIISSITGALVEVTNNQAIYFDPYDVREMSKVLSDIKNYSKENINNIIKNYNKILNKYTFTNYIQILNKNVEKIFYIKETNHIKQKIEQNKKHIKKLKLKKKKSSILSKFLNSLIFCKEKHNIKNSYSKEYYLAILQYSRINFVRKCSSKLFSFTCIKEYIRFVLLNSIIKAFLNEKLFLEEE
jgi:glycosyltransferase involved in cell wall biosynthesis